MDGYLKCYDLAKKKKKKNIPQEGWLFSVFVGKEVARSIIGAVKIRTQRASGVVAGVGNARPLTEPKSSNS
jgi:hypothetical protein